MQGEVAAGTMLTRGGEQASWAASSGSRGPMATNSRPRGTQSREAGEEGAGSGRIDEIRGSSLRALVAQGKAPAA